MELKRIHGGQHNPATVLVVRAVPRFGAIPDLMQSIGELAQAEAVQLGSATLDTIRSRFPPLLRGISLTGMSSSLTGPPNSFVK